jgi:carbonic anhydrase/acetyltransferase-like protein (isoleucine patch superfamily)
MAPQQGDVRVHPTARVHPSALLEGKVGIGPHTHVGAGAVLTGEVTVGHHSLVQCSCVIRGKVHVGNYVHVYDLVCIEQGRPAKVGGSAAEVPDESVIADYAWINHGATMHGSCLGEGAVVGLNASLNYGCRIGAGAIVMDGAACPVGFVLPANCIADGVPARVVQEDITDENRIHVMGLVPRQWAEYAGKMQEDG